MSGRVCLIAAIVVAGVCDVSGQERARTEYEIKAAYLYTFGRFVEWPARSPRREARTFDICVLGVDPFGSVLDSTVKNVMMQGRSVVARRIAAPADAGGCHILFISASEERQVATIVGALARADVLTVSDMPQFVGRGGMIQFVNAGSRVRFEISLPPAQDAGLTLSSELLRVASVVRKDRQPGA